MMPIHVLLNTSVVVLIFLCLGVKFYAGCIHILVKFATEWPPIGKSRLTRLTMWYKYLIVNLDFSNLSLFASGKAFLTMQFSDHCLPFIFLYHLVTRTNADCILTLTIKVKIETASFGEMYGVMFTDKFKL